MLETRDVFTASMTLDLYNGDASTSDKGRVPRNEEGTKNYLINKLMLNSDMMQGRDGNDKSEPEAQRAEGPFPSPR